VVIFEIDPFLRNEILLSAVPHEAIDPLLLILHFSGFWLEPRIKNPPRSLRDAPPWEKSHGYLSAETSPGRRFTPADL